MAILTRRISIKTLNFLPERRLAAFLDLPCIGNAMIFYNFLALFFAA
jgi:hypothetical protein